MTVRPMLDDLELPRVQKIEIDSDQILIQQEVPALEGDFWQRLEHGAARVRIVGVLTGSEEIEDKLKTLREKFHGGVPVPFVADITTATRVGDVVIEEMGIRELAGKAFRYEYSFTFVEFTAIEPPQPETPSEPPPPVEPEKAKLIVEVIVEGVAPDYDYSQVRVSVEGDTEDGQHISHSSFGTRQGNKWSNDDFPPGTYKAVATTNIPETLTGTEEATVTQGSTTHVIIHLIPGVLARFVVIHFWFDKAFIEPCLRPVLREIAEYARGHSDEKMLILGHTDLTGSDDYNNSLGDRRARSVYAYLTYGNHKTVSLAEWQELRKPRTPGTLPSVNDTWDVREYQHMLQALGLYRGTIDEDKGPMTRQAIRDFKTTASITPINDNMTDATWDALIEAYLDQDVQNVSDNQFFPNCNGEILKWLSCGEYDPIVDVAHAERRNRRTEVIFIRATELPRSIAKPVTFDLPQPGVVNSNWCLNPDGTSDFCCVVKPHTKSRPNCPDNDDLWQRTLLHPTTFNMTGSIKLSDGSAPNPPVSYVLIAPNGQYLTGEHHAGPTGTRGRPIATTKTATDGTFAYQNVPEGWFIIQVPGHVVQVVGQPASEVKGDFDCKRLSESDTQLDVVILPLNVALVQPFILVEGEQ